ncbi:amino acid ABC transporter ATP-binding protein [Streptomyces purpurascens]
MDQHRRRAHRLPPLRQQAARAEGEGRSEAADQHRVRLPELQPLPAPTVLENLVEAPVSALRRPRKEAEETARRLLERVGLADKTDAYPRQLSGGQQQRVAIARALALEPKVLLFDEPTSALDPELVGEVLDVIKDLGRTGTTMIVVTHEIGFAREVADTVVFMDGGVVVEQGPPSAVLDAPQHERTRAFLSKVL